MSGFYPKGGHLLADPVGVPSTPYGPQSGYPAHFTCNGKTFTESLPPNENGDRTFICASTDGNTTDPDQDIIFHDDGTYDWLTHSTTGASPPPPGPTSSSTQHGVAAG